MQPSRSQLETYRGWSPAWLASWLPFDIAFSPLSSPPSSTAPPSLFPSFSFLPRRKLFTRRISRRAGWVWRLSTVDWPVLAARQILLAILTWPNVSLYLSLFLSPSPVLSLLPFFAPFSRRPYFFFDPEPSRHYFTSVFSSFIVLMPFPLSSCAVFDGCFLVFPRLSPLSLYSLPSCNFVSRVFCTLYSHSQNASLLSAPGRVRLSNSDFCRRNQPWEFIRLTYYNLNLQYTRKMENFLFFFFFW